MGKSGFGHTIYYLMAVKRPLRSYLTWQYKYLYIIRVTSKGSKSRIKWEGDSRKQIRTWPEAVRSNLGLELHRLENFETPLDAKAVGKGISELRDQDRDSWYRVLYAMYAGWVYVLHCFKKKTRKLPKRDRQLAGERFQRVRERGDAYPSEEQKNA